MSSTHAEEDLFNTNYLKAGTGVKSLLLTLDHKRIGLMYLVSVIMAVSPGASSPSWVRLSSGQRAFTIMNAAQYNRAFAPRRDHGVPLHHPVDPASLGNFVLPMMLGAKDSGLPEAQPPELLHLRDRDGLRALLHHLRLGRHRVDLLHRRTRRRRAPPLVSMTLAVFILRFSSILTGPTSWPDPHAARASTLGSACRFLVGACTPPPSCRCSRPGASITLFLLAMERVFGPASSRDASLRRRPGCSSSTSSGSTCTPPLYIMSRARDGLVE